MLVACGCVLATGFFFAARQHFTSMDLGIKNSRLRRQLEDLESENRRLLLAKEVSLSPGEIKKTARNLGFREIEVTNIALQSAVPGTKSKAATFTAAKYVTLNEKWPVVKMTASQKPVKTSYPETGAKPQAGKVAKKLDVAKDKKDRKEITGFAKLR